MSQVTSDAESVSAPVPGSDRPPRSAALRFGGRSLNPGPRAGRAPPVAGAGGPSPARCPRDGRCGAEAPVAHAASGVLGPRRRGSPRVAVSRLAPLRCARSTRPPLGPLGDLELRRRPASRAPLVRSSCTFVPGRGPQTPLRGRVSDSDGLSPRPRTPGGVRPRKALRTAYTASEEFRRRRPRTFVPGGAAPPRPVNVTTLTAGNPISTCIRPSGWGLIVPAPPRERNPNGPAALPWRNGPARLGN